MNNYY